MSITLPLIASLLFILSQATEFKYDIEPTRCGVDTACFVRQSCIVEKKDDPPSKNVLAQYSVPVPSDPNKELTSNDCEVFVQMNALSESKYLVIMKVKLDTSSTDKLDKTGFGLYQNGEEQMVCKDLQTPSGNTANFAFESKGAGSNEHGDFEIFCSFIVTSTGKKMNGNYQPISDPYEVDPYNNKKPSFEFSIENQPRTVLTYSTVGKKLWKTPIDEQKCKLEEIISSPSDDEHYQLEEVDILKKEIECSGEMTLRAISGTQSKEGNKIVCDGDNKKWRWDDGSEVDTSNPPVTVGCVKLRYCTACADTIKEACTTDDDCTTPSPGTTQEGCKTLQCPENSFVSNLDKKNVKIDNGVKCKKSAAGAAWFIDETNEVTKLSCRTTIPCDVNTLKEHFTCPEDIEGCEKPKEVGTEDLTCNEGKKLHEDGEPYQLNCDKKTGTYKAKDGGKIYCAKDKDADSAGKEEAPSTGSNGLTIGLVALGIVAAMAIVGVGVWQGLKYYKKKKAGAASKGAPASSTKASNKKSSEKSKSKSAEVRAKDKKESGSSGSSEKPNGVPTGETPKEPAKAEETPKDKVETPGATPAATAPATPSTPATPATPAAAPAAAAAAAPKSNPDDQTANAPV